MLTITAGLLALIFGGWTLAIGKQRSEVALQQAHAPATRFAVWVLAEGAGLMAIVLGLGLILRH